MNEEQTNKVTVWAVTAPGFTIGSLAEQVKRSRAEVDCFTETARQLLREWKARGKVKFNRGQWKWVIN
jgi:hypothetical protein